jgi:hypothetical protein
VRIELALLVGVHFCYKQRREHSTHRLHLAGAALSNLTTGLLFEAKRRLTLRWFDHLIHEYSIWPLLRDPMSCEVAALLWLDIDLREMGMCWVAKMGQGFNGLGRTAQTTTAHARSPRFHRDRDRSRLDASAERYRRAIR